VGSFGRRLRFAYRRTPRLAKKERSSQLALLRPGPEVTALRELFSELVTDPDIVRRLSDLLSGAENRYILGALDADVHPLVGRWVPDFAVASASRTQRVAELARDGRRRRLGPTRTNCANCVARPRIGSGST